MCRNYLVVAVRNLVRHKTISLITVLGLAVGMACCILMVLMVEDDLTSDRHHANADRVCRVLRSVRTEVDGESCSTLSPGPLATTLQEELPEVEQAVRLYSRRGWVGHNTASFRQQLCVADPSILDVFTLPLTAGDPRTALASPSSVVITETIARKFFGTPDPLGEVIRVEDEHLGGEYRVTGILEDIPRNSHLRFDVLISSARWLPALSWYFSNVHTYVLLSEGQSPASLARKVSGVVERHIKAETGAQVVYHLQPITRINVYSFVDYGLPAKSDPRFLYLFSGFALFILLIACINYTNLLSARLCDRAQEVGVRKTMGANRRDLISQFLRESCLLALIALLLAITLVELVLPIINEATEKQVALLTNEGILTAFGLLGFALLTGVASGAYPGIRLTAVQPAQAMRGAVGAGAKGIWLRRGLVTFQFFLASVLVVSALILHRQSAYIKGKDLGFDTDRMVVLPVFRHDRHLTSECGAVRDAFLQNPDVVKATVSNSMVGMWGGSAAVRPSGEEMDQAQMTRLSIDEHFLSVFGLELLAGKNLSGREAADAGAEVLLNQTAARRLGFGEPIGQRISVSVGDEVLDATVVGVVKDFHTTNLVERIGPVVALKWTPDLNFVYLKIGQENIPETLAFIKETWRRFVPTRACELSFLDERIERMYSGWTVGTLMLGVFCALAISVACLGLLGLVLHVAKKRTKEIGIRKALGASVPALLLLLGADLLKLVAVANVIAWPVAYKAMVGFLQDYAYRASIGAETYVLAGALTLLIAVTTVGYQALKASIANPIEALRYE